MLRIDTTLHTLHLGFNKIGNEGTVEIANILSINTSLRTLNLRYDDTGNKGAIEIAKLLESNYTLTNVFLEIVNSKLTEIINKNKIISRK